MKVIRSRNNRIRYHFLGGGVTGSLHLIEYSNGPKTTRFVLDAGLYQETSARNFENRLPAGIKAADIDFVVFSHAHIDHTGYFPRLVKEGFTGPAYATHATVDLTNILLPDCGFLQEEECKTAIKRQQSARKASRNANADDDKSTRSTSRNHRQRKGSSKTNRQASSDSQSQLQPLYTEEDARNSLQQLVAVDYDTPVNVADDIVVRFTHASHLLGAAVVTVELGTGSTKRRIVFSGDLGRPGMQILKNLEEVKLADYVICEGTYGDRLHDKRDRLTALAEVINNAYKRASAGDEKSGHGVIVIPAFAVGRVQSVLYDLRQLMYEKRISEIPVFVDSPMAIRATHVYRHHKELYNSRAKRLSDKGVDLFRTPRYAELNDWTESVKLDAPQSEPIIVIASSGMATGGRILRHLTNRLPGGKNTVIFTGYQSEGTLGRQIVNLAGLATEGKPALVKIAGVTVPVRAAVEHLRDYSGHGDYRDMINWLRGFKTRPKKLFLVHGDEGALVSFKSRIQEALGWDSVVIPKTKDHFDLT